MPVKKRKLMEAVVKKEMKKEIKEVMKDEKLKSKGRPTDNQQAKKVTASFSFGITPADIEATLNRYAARNEIGQDVAARLFITLSHNIVELTAEKDLEGDCSPESIAFKSETVKELLFEQLIDRIIGGLWVKVKVE